ncbi:MAG: RHS repeat-associated core domain-containing protein, partial [Phycisphaerales bacterium]|nr:RHS repeat-associated core domain-containing protein [Phycisphaerales bacterium]
LMLRETIESDLNSDGDLADQDEGTRVKTYTWGKDLGGGLESAGGIGGLLAVYDDSATSGSTGDDLAYVYMYDANGNVGQICDLSQSTASASIVAKYEYDAYGNAPVSSGSYASANTYRFSTKPWDDETGLGYWGYRYYDPRLGRWMSRDPLDEIGGLNLYAFLENGPIAYIDSLGLSKICPPGQYYHPQFGCVRYMTPVPPPEDSPGLPEKPCPTGKSWDDPIDLDSIFDAVASQGDSGCGTCFRINPRGWTIKSSATVDRIDAGCKKTKSQLEKEWKLLVGLAKKLYWFTGFEQECEAGCQCKDKKAIPRGYYTFNQRLNNVYLEYDLIPKPGPKKNGCTGDMTITFTMEMDGWYGKCAR